MVKSELISRVITRIKEGYKPERVIVFGSHAWGEPEPGSDLDLCVIKETKTPGFRRAREIRRLLREENREIAMDILVLTPEELQERLDAKDSFITRICSQGEEVDG